MRHAAGDARDFIRREVRDSCEYDAELHPAVKCASRAGGLRHPCYSQSNDADSPSRRAIASRGSAATAHAPLCKPWHCGITGATPRFLHFLYA